MENLYNYIHDNTDVIVKGILLVLAIFYDVRDKRQRKKDKDQKRKDKD